jgi:predicted glycoside hydrolase/deacetylase ChbG (UPF0249 family)
MRASTLLVASLAIVMILMMSDTDAQDIRLIVRGDDLGMTQGSLVAFEKAFNEGVLTCASIIVPAPWFEAAADLIRNNPSWCIGVHLTLIGEWRGYRWRPVLPWNSVKSIVDEDGFLYRYPDELLARMPRIEEIDAEWRAQINLALKRGIKLQYLDFHYMGPASYPGLNEMVRRLSRDYNLPVSGTLGEKGLPGIYKTPLGEKTKLAVKTLENLKPGLWLWVFHPGIDSPEHNALIHTKHEDVFKDGNVGKHRAAETEMLRSPRVKAVIKNRAIKLTTYGVIWKELQERN